ncbi:ABC transporter permease [Aquipuribacter sp. MA13-6]|uniref:ABC transporter permease n=1 Tax=unclassified Aquipuribacter TaxID=2635084 RepID=UPI003EECF5B4
MTTSTRPGGPATTAHRHREDGRAARRTGTGTGPATGTGPLLRFALRRDRLRLPVWVAVAAALVGVQSVSSQQVYDTPESLQQYARTAEASAAVVAMTGRPVGLDTVERAVAFEITGVVAVVVALMSVFTVVRHTRADETEGRTELVRATAVGRRAPLLAAMALAVLANLGVLLAVTAVGVGTSLPLGGSLLLGASLAGAGVVFTGVAAVTAQLAAGSRAASSTAGALVGVAFLLRAVGDVQENLLSWLSPIGWAQATYPFHTDRWWPLLLCLGVGAMLVGAAVALLDRRDLGAGLLPDRPGRATAGWALGTPLGLAWRLQRGTVTGWSVGLVGVGVVYGSLVTATEDLVEQTPELMELLPGGADDVLAGYLVITAGFLAVLSAAAGVAMALRLRGEEAAGRAEPVLATASSRTAWAASHLTVALVASAGLLVGSALVVGLTAVATGVPAGVVGDVALGGLVLVPAVWLLVGLTAALWGADPRLASLGWLGVAWAAVVLMLGDSLDLPGWLRGLSPLHHVPAVPLEDATATAPLVLLGLAVGTVVLGVALWGRRDLRTG